MGGPFAQRRAGKLRNVGDIEIAVGIRERLSLGAPLHHNYFCVDPPTTDKCSAATTTGLEQVDGKVAQHCESKKDLGQSSKRIEGRHAKLEASQC